MPAIPTCNTRPSLHESPDVVGMARSYKNQILK